MHACDAEYVRTFSFSTIFVRQLHALDVNWILELIQSSWKFHDRIVSYQLIWEVNDRIVFHGENHQITQEISAAELRQDCLL